MSEEQSDLPDRVAAVEARLAAVEDELAGRRQATETTPGEVPTEADFAPLAWLSERVPDEPGAVLFTGRVGIPGGGQYKWQQAGTTEDLLGLDWGDLHAKLSALAHPVRLMLLRRILGGARSVADLQDDDTLGTSGQLYHHLRQLVSAGWLQSTGRGHYAVPGQRVVPLLVIMEAVRR